LLLAQRNRKLLGQMQHHFARRLGAAAFDEGEMPLRDIGFHGKVELAHVPARAPFANEASGGDFGCGHG